MCEDGISFQLATKGDVEQGSDDCFRPKQTFKPLAKYTVEKIAFKNFGASVQPRKREDS